MIEKTKHEIKDIIMRALGALTARGEIEATTLPAFNVEIPAESSHGDFSCNAALTCAKTLRMKPRDLATLLHNEADLNESSFARCEIAGPGFLNFFLNEKWYVETVKTVLEQKENYGRVNSGNGKRVLIEFVSANPTGPMHIGNARGGAIGDCLAGVLEFAGCYVEREFYLNDTGNQIDKLGLSLDYRYQQLAESDGSPVEMPDDSYHGDDIIQHARGFRELYGDEPLALPQDERRRMLVDYALPINIKTLETDLLRYRIKYDTWFRESSLYETTDTAKSAAVEIVDKLGQNGYTYEKEGAVWFRATDLGLDKDIVLIRANGVPTYIVADIAYHYNKLVTRGFDLAIDIMGADHHGYKARMETALKALNVDYKRLNIIICQMVRLVRGGETVKLSKRSGKAITLRTLLDEVPIDAARFVFNLRDANTHLDFDLDLAIEESSKNPVYYVQYAHARICGVIRKLEEEGEFYSGGGIVFSEPAEFGLIRKIAMFPTEVALAADEFNPSRLTRYVVDLAGLYHRFYDSCRIKGEAEKTIQSRLALCLSTRLTIKNVLGLLKVDAPEKM
ncbi:MAG: arginine--tRNA ligase [Oscillospiraceae bacterium]|nr:arginine--tRNA ligase [Oscillospiraceae bacterium]